MIKYIENIKEQSINIKNYFEDICEMCDDIDKVLTNNTLNGENYSAVVDTVVQKCTAIDSKIRINQVLIKTFTKCLISAHEELSKFHQNVVLKKHEKDSVTHNDDRPVNVLPLEIEEKFYYDITFPAIINNIKEDVKITIAPIKLEECGSIATLLIDRGLAIKEDMTKFLVLAVDTNTTFTYNASPLFFANIPQIIDIIKSNKIIEALNNGEGNDDIINEIYNITTTVSCLKNEAKEYIKIIDVLTNTVAALDKNCYIINKALNEYVSMDTIF